ncbi:MAG: peptidoglycan editing factor PgeF [Paludibacteraceae bacterium]
MIKLITYPIFSQFEEINHFTSTRNTGVSQGDFFSLNLGVYSGDEAENIQKNFNLLFDFIGIKPYQLFIPHQTHGDEIMVIDNPFLNQDNETQKTLLYGKDALITNLPNVYVGVTTADCVPILIYDPVKKAVGAVHAGWRGTCAKVLSKTIEKMGTVFNSNPSDMLAAIGPSISVNVYDVGNELIAEFKNAGFNTYEIFQLKDEKVYLDLWEANGNLLLEKGLRNKNIEVTGRCTFTEYETFFSARKLGIKSGRMISVIGINL